VDGYVYQAGDEANEVDSFTYKDETLDKEYTVRILRIPSTDSLLVMKVNAETGKTEWVDDATQISVREDFLKDENAVQGLDVSALEKMPAVQKYDNKDVETLREGKEELARYKKDKDEYVLYQVSVDNRVGLACSIDGAALAAVGAEAADDAIKDAKQDAVLEEYKSEHGFTKASGFGAVGIIAWAAISYILWGMTYTIGDIPLWGVTSLMTEDQRDRAKALSLARICASFGAIGMAFTFIAPSFQGIFKDRGFGEAKSLQYAYILTAIILTVFSSILFQFAGLSVHERVEQSNESHTMKENFQTMWRCLPFRKLLISGVLRSPIQLLSTVAITLVMYFFFNNDLLGKLKPDGKLNIALVIKVVLLFIGIMGGMLVSSGMSPGIAEKVGKKRLYNIYSFLGAVPFVFVFIIYLIAGKKLLVEWVGPIIISLVFVVASGAQGGLNVLQSVMIADCVDYEEYNNGVRPDGVFFAGQSFITKLSAGIATLISGAVYGFVGFSDSKITFLNNALIAGADFKTFNPFTLGGAEVGKFSAAMFFLISIPPAIGMVLAAIPTLKYALPDKEHTRILDELNAKRNAENAGTEE
jgi:Na+/melibiose symporter-like transporter